MTGTQVEIQHLNRFVFLTFWHISFSHFLGRKKVYQSPAECLKFQSFLAKYVVHMPRCLDILLHYTMPVEIHTPRELIRGSMDFK